MSIMASVATSQPIPPRDLRPETSLPLSKLIMQLLAKDPRQRPATARIVLDHLEPGHLEPGSLEPVPSTKASLSASPASQQRIGRAPLTVALLLSAVVIWFAGGPVLRYATNRGRLVIEIDDPHVVVRVLQNEVVVQDWTTKREFTLTASNGTIEVTADGDTMFTAREFDLKRGATTIVSVRCEPAAQTNVESAREMAELILAQNGTFVTDPKEHLFVKPGDRLPDSISGFYWIWWDQPNRAGIDTFLKLSAALPNHPELLYLGGQALSDADIHQLTESPTLRRIGYLALRESNLSKNCLASLTRMQRLAFLSLEIGHESDEWLPEVAKLTELTGFGIPNSRITDAGLTALRGMRLEVLNLYACRRITGAGLDSLGEMASLIDLNLHETSITDADLDRLQRFPKLSTLWLGATAVTDSGLARLQSFKRLRNLELSDLSITDAGIQQLAKCTQLEYLNLTRNAISLQGLKTLREALPRCKIESELDPKGTTPSDSSQVP